MGLAHGWLVGPRAPRESGCNLRVGESAEHSATAGERGVVWLWCVWVKCAVWVESCNANDPMGKGIPTYTADIHVHRLYICHEHDAMPQRSA